MGKSAWAYHTGLQWSPENIAKWKEDPSSLKLEPGNVVLDGHFYESFVMPAVHFWLEH